METLCFDNHMVYLIPSAVSGRQSRRPDMRVSAMASRFTRGSAVFKCNVCGRATRHTGAQAIGNRICPQCWDLAGIENEISDGHATRDERREEITRLVAEVAAKGGDVSEWAALVGEAS